MLVDVVTAFPAMVAVPLKESILKRAVEKELVKINIFNLRDWAKDRHKTLDDSPYGGGAGMILKVEPLYDCLKVLTANESSEKSAIFLTSPRGKMFNQADATRISLLDHIIIVCGRYKGVDERIKEFFPVSEISVGDFVLSGGEFAALIIIDSVVRLLPGVLNDINSAWTDSFSDGLLDCNYYTRPEVFRDKKVPSVLLGGDHKKIDEWRQNQRENITKQNRPDLYEKYKNNS